MAAAPERLARGKSIATAAPPECWRPSKCWRPRRRTTARSVKSSAAAGKLATVMPWTYASIRSRPVTT